MDVSDILAAHTAKQYVIVEKDTPLEVDPGFLLVSDLNPINEESYNENKEDYLQSLARDGVQSLMSSLFSLPIKPSPDGPLAILPPPIYQLPRAKPLPKPKPPTKWERFAAAKGIQKKVREKKVWDEEKQDWVNRWGKGGKNREKEEQWLHEVPANADADHDPRKVARDERKERIAKNEKKHQQNLASGTAPTTSIAPPLQQRKAEIDRTLATTRMSTASMGNFDRRLDGEKKLRGVKRKFEPAEASVDSEKNASLDLLAKMESEGRKMKQGPRAQESVLNVRKAIRFQSKGRGAVALARQTGSNRSQAKTRGKR